MQIVIDKFKAIKKWAPIFDSLDIKDDRKRELMAILGEFIQMDAVTNNMGVSNNMGMGGLATPIANPFSSPSTPSSSHFGSPDILLPLQFKIFSKLNLENKVVIIAGYNDDRITINGPLPKEKITIKIEQLIDDKQLERKMKLQKINSPTSFPFPAYTKIDRVEGSMVNYVISDINARLKYGNILFINRRILESFAIAGSDFEIIVKYDVI